MNKNGRPTPVLQLAERNKKIVYINATSVLLASCIKKKLEMNDSLNIKPKFNWTTCPDGW